RERAEDERGHINDFELAPLAERLDPRAHAALDAPEKSDTPLLSFGKGWVFEEDVEIEGLSVAFVVVHSDRRGRPGGINRASALSHAHAPPSAARSKTRDRNRRVRPLTKARSVAPQNSHTP